MRITPIEIQQQQFKTRLLGYDTSAVDGFLEMLADELERVHKQSNELKDALARTRISLEQMREREKVLQETLMAAHQVTEELKLNARRDAEIVLAEAHIEGQQIVRDAIQRRVQIVNEIQEIRRQKISFEGGLRALIDSHLKLMELDALQIEEQEYQARLLQPLISDDEIEDPLKFPK